MPFYHGGVKGKQPGDVLVPSPPHVEDDCPICKARAAGRTATVGEYRLWLLDKAVAAPAHVRERLRAVFEQLAEVPFYAPMDPPSQREAVYVTVDKPYARHYAARSRGDLYEVEPLGEREPTAEDPFPTWTVAEARVVRVVERDVLLMRRDRRALQRRWAKADKQRAKERA